MSEDDDLARLFARLERLSAPPAPTAPEGRQIGVAPGLMRALLREVDETMLARQLRFVTDRGPDLVCEVYGGRLLTLRGPVPGAGQALADRKLAAEDAEALHAALDGFLAGAHMLWVRAQPLDKTRDPAALGIAATTLATAWEIDLTAEEPALQPLESLLSALGDQALAWLRVTDGVIGPREGATDPLGRLVRFAAEAIPALREDPPPPSDTPAPPRCVVLGRRIDGGTLIFAEDGNETLVLLVAAEAVVAATTAWRQAVG